MYLQWVLMQSREQSHLKCQLSCPLACTSQGPAGALANTCVCAVLCIHVSCATGLTEASHVQRLLQNADPNPRSFVGVTEDFPHVMCLL